MGNAVETELRVAAAIRNYFALHPHAKDTAQGIAEWWLGDEAATSVEVVRRALRRLVSDGFVRVESGSSGELYCADEAPGSASRPDGSNGESDGHG
jgi:Bacterial regulatory proteins, gntR family